MMLLGSDDVVIIRCKRTRNQSTVSIRSHKPLGDRGVEKVEEARRILDGELHGKRSEDKEVNFEYGEF